MDCWDCRDGRLLCLDDRSDTFKSCTFIAPGSMAEQAMGYLAEDQEPVFDGDW